MLRSLFALLLLLSACAIAQPSMTTSAFDGVYTGRAEVTFNRDLCTPATPTLTIVGGHFVVPRRAGSSYEGTVSTEGKFAAATNVPYTSVLRGTVDGKKAVGTLSNAGCAWDFELTKVE
jgi:hypothetical protein